MNINIKNARRLEATLDDEIARLKNKIFDREARYKDTAQSLAGTKSAIDTYMDKLTKFKEIRQTIRDLIGEFNVEKGINSTTASIAIKVDELELYERLSNMSEPRMTKDWDDVKYATPGISRAEAEAHHATTLKLKREIQRLKDKCQGINSSGTIELSAETESFLKLTGLMD